MIHILTAGFLRRWQAYNKNIILGHVQLSAIGYRLSAITVLFLSLIVVFTSTQVLPHSPDGYVRPDFAQRISTLRPEILEAAQRHNRPEISHMTDEEFAVVIAQVLYNEHFGWLEEAVPPLQAITPLYQEAQVQLNIRTGANLSIWPANLRPSVAEEILRGEVPLRAPEAPMYIPIVVHGSHIRLSEYPNGNKLNDALSAEIRRPELAVEYVAANLERGLLRAQHEGVPVTWQTLAAWHNQGIVAPADIRNNATTKDYVKRASAYRGLAEALIDGK